jgi:hypothetical protein
VKGQVPVKKTVSQRKLERLKAVRQRTTSDSEQGLSSVKRAENELKVLLANYDPHSESRVKQLLEILRTKGGYYDGTFAKYRDLARQAALEYEKSTHPI